MTTKYLTAVVICKVNGSDLTQGIKYRNIPRQAAQLKRLMSYVNKNFPYADHINLYDRDTKKFTKQIPKQYLVDCIVPVDLV